MIKKIIVAGVVFAVITLPIWFFDQKFGPVWSFFFTLFAAWIIAEIVRWNVSRRFKKNVYSELAGVYLAIQSNKNQHTLLYYYLPIWDSVIASAILVNLKILDYAFLRSLFKIYGHIKMLHDCEQEESKTGKTQPSKAVLDKRANLKKAIEEDSKHFAQIKKLVEVRNKKADKNKNAEYNER